MAIILKKHSIDQLKVASWPLSLANLSILMVLEEIGHISADQQPKHQLGQAGRPVQTN